MALKLDVDSLERIVPSATEDGETTGGEAMRLALDRYRFAAGHVRPGRLLDAACGSGYGTRLLADQAGCSVDALGIDLSEQAVAFATEHFASSNVSYRAANAMSFADPEGFDTIVSIETIEHLPDPATFCRQLASMLREGGVLVASAPVTPSVDANPYHLHDFSEASFLNLFDGLGLEPFDTFRQRQPFDAVAVLRRTEPRMEGMRRNLARWYVEHPDAFARRLWSTVRHGFANKYLTVAMRR